MAKKQFGPTLSAVLTADISQFEKQMIKAQKTLQKMQSKFTKIGMKLSFAVTLPLALMAKSAVKSFADFDDAMTKSTAIMGKMTAETRKQMEITAKEISKNGVIPATELAKAYFFLASAGLDAKQSMAALPAVASFATAGNFDMATATDLLTDAQSALGMTSKDAIVNLKNMTKISDTLVKANTMANASVRQFSESLTNDAAVAAKQFGMDLETTVAVLSAYADQGIKGAQAGTLLGRATRLMAQAARKNEDAFRKMNIQVIGKDGQYKNFIQIIGQMETAFQHLTKPQIAAKLEMMGFATLAQKAITPLLGMTEQMGAYEESLKDVTGYTESVADKQMKSFMAQWDNLKNRLEIVKIEIGEQLMPMLVKLMKQLEGLTEWFVKLDSGMQSTIVEIGLLAVAAGPLLLVVNQIATAVTLMGGVMSAVIAGALVDVYLLIKAYKEYRGLIDDINKAQDTREAHTKRYDERQKRLFNESMGIKTDYGSFGAQPMVWDSIAAPLEKIAEPIAKAAEPITTAADKLTKAVFELRGVADAWKISPLGNEFNRAYDQLLSTFGGIAGTFGGLGGGITNTMKSMLGGTISTTSASTFSGRTAGQELGTGNVQERQLEVQAKQLKHLERIDRRGRLEANQGLLVGAS